ncbi:synaptonemal complex protein 3 [Rousettus aegyptiacus]|uniref:Synaptonemal complex protein 3 n=2 Tax=Rousettus aegyptiacus TaxID=9407 RepID=A0A7J8EM27_ROUAE|nr:synaptonemal complex protein 3 [Rousettus aegyptiacus]KAF6436490.1 synaptonemal complex protein 3 [Rousettus aegyptiacus]
MMSSGRKNLPRMSEATMKDQDVDPYDFLAQERLEMSGSQDLFEGNNSVPDNNAGESPSGQSPSGINSNELGSELQNMLAGIEGDMRKVLQAKRKRFITNTNASLEVINQKLIGSRKKHQEKRLKHYHKYSQQFTTLFQEWDADVQKAKAQEERLAILFQEQRKIFQQARLAQIQKLKKMKTLYDEFLKSMEDLEKSHEYFLTNEESEFKQELASMHKKIMLDAQQQELAVVKKSLESLLF